MGCTPALGADPQVVTTFHSAGLYWQPAGAGENVTCTLEYRQAGSDSWNRALDPWFDPRTPEYRGSVVHLTPDTSYEFKLTLSTGAIAIVPGKTMSQRFPVGDTHFLPPQSSQKITITKSGSPEGYLLITPHPGQTATIDVDNQEDCSIEVDASYVILRGLTIRGGINHGIVLKGNAHHVIIERCDISGFGKIMSDGWGREGDAAVFSEEPAIHDIIVQRCRIHHPRSDSNSWDEPRPVYKNNAHPQGPQAISFYRNNAGHNIFRYNEIYSDIDHMFNDGIGGSHNFSTQGFPGRDSDVYGNIVMDCWDNPLEMEGGGMNVRVWGNYIDRSYTGIGTIPTSVGPLYVFRNVANKLFKGHAKTTGQRFFKSGNAQGKKFFGDGRVYLFHNTMLQEKIDGRNFGGGTGLADTGHITNYVTRNNIWYLSKDSGTAIRVKAPAEPGFKANDFDFDMYNGQIISSEPSFQPHGIKAEPVWAEDNIDMYNPLQTGKIRVALAPDSPGVDAAQPLPNFNDGFAGAGPDMGANERGVTMEFGVEAYLPQEE